MPIYQAIILAVVQGLTEFLPVSSTAHLAVIPRLFGWTDRGLDYDVALHVGTLLAVLIYFFRDWIQVVANGFGLSYRGTRPDENSRMLLWFLLAATIPGALAGKLLKNYAEGPWRNLFVIGVSMILLGILMGVADRVGKEKNGLDQMNWMDALLIGIGQAFAIIPGVSRSGSTITVGRFRHLDREAAARFSFLLSTPIIAGAALSDAFDMRKTGIPADMKMPYLVGMIVSAAVGVVVIAFFLQYLRRHSLSVFVWYRVVFGIMVIALAVFFRNGG